jgi:hypothetical protein
MSPIIWILNKKETKSKIEFEMGNTGEIQTIKSKNFLKKNNGLRIFFKSIKQKFKIFSPKFDDINNIDKYSRLCFPILFIIFNLFYWIVYYLQINTNF